MFKSSEVGGNRPLEGQKKEEVVTSAGADGWLPSVGFLDMGFGEGFGDRSEGYLMVIKDKNFIEKLGDSLEVMVAGDDKVPVFLELAYQSREAL